MWSIGWLSPAFLVGALAVAVPIVLHLMKREPSRAVPFPALRLLRPDVLPHARRQRLQRLLLLALRATALVLLAVAFARPYLVGSAAVAGPLTVVAVDTSFSMSAPGAFDRARRQARRAVDQSAGPVALVTFADSPETVVPPTADHARVLAALDRLEPGSGGTRYRPAIVHAADLAAPGGRLVVVTDLQRGGWQGDGRASIPSTVRMEVRDIGAPGSNLACADLHPTDAGLEAVVRNFGGTDVVSRVHLRIDGRLVATRPVTLPAGGAVAVAFDGQTPARGVAMAAVDDAQGFQADNSRYLVLDPPAPASVLLVTGARGSTAGAFYVDRALRVDDGRLFAVTTMGADQVGRVDAGTLLRYGAVIVLATEGLDPRGRRALVDYVRDGGGLLLGAGPDTAPRDAGELAGTSAVPTLRTSARPLALVMADPRHPILRGVGQLAANAAEVRVSELMTVAGGGSPHVLLRLSDGSPALFEIQRGSGRLLLFASDLGNRWNDLPLQPMFLPLLHEIGRYLSAGRGPVQHYTIGQLPPGIPARPGVVTLKAAASPAKADAPGQQSYRAAVNIDIAESDTSRMSAQEFLARVDAPGGAGDVAGEGGARLEDIQRWWRFALFLMMLALIAETVVARRTL